jgi:hypothetical protein
MLVVPLIGYKYPVRERERGKKEKRRKKEKKKKKEVFFHYFFTRVGY